MHLSAPYYLLIINESSLFKAYIRYLILLKYSYLQSCKLSQESKQNYDKTINDLFEKNLKLLSFDKPNIIDFVQGDFLKQSWENATIIFANSTCFSTDLINSIAEKANKECKKGTIIITFTKKLNKLNSEWETKEGFRRLMTWGIATIYVHKRR